MEVMGVQTSPIAAWLLLVIFNVPFLISCNSTTNPAIESQSNELERSISLLSNDVLDVVVIVLQRKLSGFENVELRLDFDLQYSSHFLVLVLTLCTMLEVIIRI
jgi:hypothetical protein